METLLKHKLNHLHKFPNELGPWHNHVLLRDSTDIRSCGKYLITSTICLDLRYRNNHELRKDALLDAFLRNQTHDFNDLLHDLLNGLQLTASNFLFEVSIQAAG